MYIQLAEFVQPEGDELRADSGLGDLFIGDLDLQILLGSFQFFQPALGGLGEDALLDGVQQILDAGFRFPELLLVQGKTGVFTILQIHHHGNDGFNGFVVHDHLHHFVDHQIFQPLFPNRLFLAVRPLLFYRYALVVVMNGSVPAFAALATEVSTAVAAEEFRGQQVIILGFVTGRGFSVLRQLFLNPIKQIFWADGRDSVGNDNVPVFVLSNITTVTEHVLNAVEVQRFS